MLPMKKTLVISCIAAVLYACGGSEQKEATNNSGSSGSDFLKEDAEAEAAKDYSKGIGKFTHVELDPKLNEKMAAEGNGIYEVKCLSCHKLTTERIVGPGWAGVTERREPEWIMNFVTNVDEMLDKDPESQAMLEICMVRMPNQNLSDEDARAVLEFMRKNDGVK